MPAALRLLAALVLALVQLEAADPDAATRREAVESLHREALEQQDLWTCLQLEAYAARHDMRLPACLGRSSSVIGDALLTWPEPVVGVVDRGEQLVVVAGNHLYPIAPDGRPLGLSRRLPFTPTQLVASPDGRYLGLLALQPQGAVGLLRSAVYDLERDRRLWLREEARAAVPPPLAEVPYTLAVAADGSALGVVLRRVGLQPELRTLLVCTEAGITSHPGIATVSAVGPAGGWFLASGMPGTQGGCFVAGALAQTHPLGPAAAAGAGGAVLLDADGHQLLGADGSLSAWEPQGLAGPVLGVQTLGDWLVVSHRLPADAALPGPAAAAESVDLFAPAPAEAPAESADLFAAGDDEAAPPAAAAALPRQAVALYPWRRLLAKPTIEPSHVFPGSPFAADTQARALWLADGPDLALLDDSGPAPQTRAVTTLPAPIARIYSSHHGYVLYLVGQQVAVLDHAGEPLYQLTEAAGQYVAIIGPGLALAWRHADNSGHRLLRLDRDPERREAVPLAQWPEGASYHYARSDGTAANVVVGTAYRWMRYDPASGAVVERHPGPEPRHPDLPGVVPDNLGRMVPDPQRCQLRPLAQPELGRTTPWAIADVLLAGRSTLVLDREGTIHLEGRTGWEALARQGDLRHFVDVPGETGVFLGPNGNQATVRLQAGRGLQPFGEPRRTAARGHGSWQVTNLQYSVPGEARVLTWDSGRIGFAPLRLQGEARSFLLAFFPGIVLQLDQRAAAALGVDEATIAERRAAREAGGRPAARR